MVLPGGAVQMTETGTARPAPYDRLIDAEIWAFIDRTRALFPPGAARLDIAGRRAAYNAMARAFRAPRPAGVWAADGIAGGVPVRRYLPRAAPGVRVIYFHGGGFVLGGLDSHDDICAEIATSSGFALTSVDYRLCPEHPHPAAFRDALAVVRAEAVAGEPMLLAGDSAGGNLAAAAAHALRRGGPALAGQVLIYPVLGGEARAASFRTHAEAPMLTARDVARLREMRAGGRDVGGDASFAPLADSDFSGLPPTVIVTAECDPLSDEGRLYRDAILAAGGSAEWIEEPGLVHGYLRARHTVRRARDSFARIVAALRRMGGA